MPRIDNQALANLLDAGLAVKARVTRIRLGGAHPEIGLDLALTQAI